MFSITKRIVLALAVLVLLPSVILGLGMLRLYRNSIIELESVRLTEIADKKADQIANFVDEKLMDIRILAGSRQLIRDIHDLSDVYYSAGRDSEKYKKLNAAVHTHYKEYISIGGDYDLFLVSTKGDVVFSVLREIDFATNLFHGPYAGTGLGSTANAASTLLEPVFSEYRMYAPSSAPAAFIAAPVLENGHLAGIVVLQIDNRRFFDVVTDSTGLGKSGETEAAVADGGDALFIMPLRYARDAAMKMRIPLNIARPSPVISALRGERGVGLSIDYRNREVLAAWRYVPSARIGMVVKVDADEASAAADRLVKVGYAILFGVFGSIILMGIFLARSIITPLKLMQSATAAMAEGNLEQRVTVARSDEIGQLASSFNIMADRLHSLTAQLEQKIYDRTKELESANERLKKEMADRMKIEDELRYVSSFQLAILNSANYSIISTDVDGTIRSFNRAAEQMLGYRASEVIGKTSPAILHDPREVADRAEVLTKELGRRIEPGFEVFIAKVKGGAPDENEWTYICKDGTRFPVMLSVTPLYGEGNRITGFLGVGLDITERKAAENALRQARIQAENAAMEAERANRYKSEFLASMSHEIRTPLNSIIGFSEVLLDTPLNEEQKRLLQVSRVAGESLLYLINDILDFAKMEAGHVVLEKNRMNVGEIVETCFEIMSFKAKEKKLSLSWVIDENVVTAVVGDAGRLRQILLNLLGNAIKFSEKGAVRLAVKMAEKDNDREKINFSVSDEGIGIPPEKREIIFERFKQADASVTRKYGGTGLGLSISKMLVELMGGTIWVESEPGKGSTFHFSAVFGRESLAGAETGFSNELRGIRVIAYCPEKSRRGELGRILRAAGAIVHEAETIPHAVEIISSRAVDKKPVLAVVGYCNAEMADGCAIADSIRRLGDTPQPALFMVASSALCGDLEKRETLRLDCRIGKPLKAAEMVQAIAGTIAPLMREMAATGVEAPRKEGGKILLVEDNQDNRLLIKAYLKGTDHVLTMAENGREAVDKFKLEKYDLVLMDVQMPIMDGYTATREIRAYEQEKGVSPTPIVALTAHAFNEDIENSIQAGCNRHIAKPIKKATLLEIIDTFV